MQYKIYLFPLFLLLGVFSFFVHSGNVFACPDIDCGTADGVPFATEPGPTSALCTMSGSTVAFGNTNPVMTGTEWEWACWITDPLQPSPMCNDYCSAPYIAPAPQCSSSVDGQTFYTTETTLTDVSGVSSLCTSGTPNPIQPDSGAGSTWSWTCEESGHTDASCSATRAYCGDGSVQNGNGEECDHGGTPDTSCDVNCQVPVDVCAGVSCGSAESVTFTDSTSGSEPTQNLCSGGVSPGVTLYNLINVSCPDPPCWRWECWDTNTTQSCDICFADIDESSTCTQAQCGTSDGQSFSSEPTTNLCTLPSQLSSDGVATTTGPDGWSWTCVDPNFPDDTSCQDSCSANQTTSLCPDVSCGSATLNTYSSTNSLNAPDPNTEELCTGSDFGSIGNVELQTDVYFSLCANPPCWRWECISQSGTCGQTCFADICSASCNTATESSGPYATTPSANLCATGTASTVLELDDALCEDDGTCWTWGCEDTSTGQLCDTCYADRDMCGDGVVDDGEQCDDGNTVDNDACTNSCENAICGDGIIRTGIETCDDGNTINGDGCNDICESESCGDGVVQNGEQCDDGNTINDDECSNNCTNCGNGILNIGEQCDDGNTANGDGCDSMCREEKEEEEDCDGTIGNEVYFDQNGNGVRDANEHGISGVRLKLFHGNDKDTEKTNKHGNYEFEDLCEGRYTVEVDQRDIPKGCYQTADPDKKLDNQTTTELDDNDDNKRNIDFGYKCPIGGTIPQTGGGLTPLWIALLASSFLTILFFYRVSIFHAIRRRFVR